MAFKNIKKSIELMDGNYVAIGVTIGRRNNEVNCGHSAIFISKGKEKSIFHWIDGNIRLDDFSDSSYDRIRNNYFGCYLKYLNKLEDSDIDSILAILSDIKDHSSFAYGFVFNGGLYNENGDYFSENGLEEIGTCVTLCTNVFKTLLVTIEDYFYYGDWELILPNNHDYHKFLNSALVTHPNMDLTLYDHSHKRIKPSEMTISSIFNLEDMAIRKNKIDGLKDSFNNYVLKLGC
jgi:hypothetical protein